MSALRQTCMKIMIRRVLNPATSISRDGEEGTSHLKRQKGRELPSSLLKMCRDKVCGIFFSSFGLKMGICISS